MAVRLVDPEKALRMAEAKIQPVLSAFKDQVLYLKHNLNAHAIAALQHEFVDIGIDIAQLIRVMEKTIADLFGEVPDSMAFFASNATRQKWRTTLRDSVAGNGYLWSDSNQIIGRPAFATPTIGRYGWKDCGSDKGRRD